MSALDLLFEPFGYTVVTGTVAFWLFVVVAGVSSIVAAVLRRPAPFLALPSFARFLIVLFIVGAFADLVWVLMFPGRLYVEPDQIVGFSPLFPFTLDVACGGHFLRGASFAFMQGVWAFFAAVTWGASWRAYRFWAREAAT